MARNAAYRVVIKKKNRTESYAKGNAATLLRHEEIYTYRYI